MLSLGLERDRQLMSDTMPSIDDAEVSLIASMQVSKVWADVKGHAMNRQAAVVLLILSALLQPSQAAEYLHPGVYLQEGPGPKRIDGVNTSSSGQVRVMPACGQKCVPAPFQPSLRPTSAKGH